MHRQSGEPVQHPAPARPVSCEAGTHERRQNPAGSSFSGTPRPTGRRCPTMSGRSPTAAARTPPSPDAGSPTPASPLDLALCSTAVRTRETWKLAVHELPAPAEDGLRGAALRGLARRADRPAQRDPRRRAATLLLVGHNPGMHALADVLAGAAEGDTRARMNRARLPDRRLRGARPSAAPGSPWSTASATLVDYWAPHD